MKPETKRLFALVAAIAAIFLATTLLMLGVMPPPHTPADYLVIGSLATLVSLVLLFAVLFGFSPGTFTKRR
jgi:hypothetical protein